MSWKSKQNDMLYRLIKQIKQLNFLNKRGLVMGGLAGFLIGFFSLLFFYPDYKTDSQELRANKQIIKLKVKRKTMKLRPVNFNSLRGWQQDDHLASLKAFQKSCRHFLTKQLRSHSAINQKRFQICKKAVRLKLTHKRQAKKFFEEQFQPYRVLTPSSLLTGYYEPEIKGSRIKTAEYNIPVYKRPSDLVSLINDKDRAAKNHQLTFMRKKGEKLEPFPTRQSIEQGALENQGLELLFLKDQVDSFFMHIQGSARIALDDGSHIRIGYDGKNGHPYSSIGKHLKNAYKFKGEQLKLEAVKQWLRDNKAEGQKVMWHNKSYIFFRELNSDQGANGPLGAEGVNLTPRRSLAVDGSYHQLGLPIWLDVASISHHGRPGFHHLMIAQDVGSAIKGPARGDIYWGSGDKAGVLAGATKHKGQFTVLLPR